LSLRKKIADSKRVARFVTSCFESYIRFSFRTSKWERLGFEPMDEAVHAGEAVIFVVWHQRLLMAPYMFDMSFGEICSLTSASRVGQMAGGLLERFGFKNISMNSRERHVVASREILKNIKQGVSIGIAADGPRGPARQSSTVPLVWARTSGKRIFTVTFSQKRVISLPTWDDMWLPCPYSKGVFMCREWTADVPRKASDEDIETLRRDLQTHLDRIADEADAFVGRT